MLNGRCLLDDQLLTIGYKRFVCSLFDLDYYDVKLNDLIVVANATVVAVLLLASYY